MEKKLTYFTCDVHLGLNVNNAKNREERFIAFLSSIDPLQTEALYLLGDIWDFWYEYKYVVPKGYNRIFSKIEELISNQVKVYFFPGNHDLWAYSYFSELGMIVKREAEIIRIGDKKFCVAHGDGLGKVPLGYRILKKAFTCRIIQKIFSLIHPRLALGFGYNWSKHNRLARGEKYIFKGESEPIYQYAVQMNKAHGIDYFIFGHYHISLDLDITDTSRLIIIDSWIENSPYLIYDREENIIKKYSNKF